MSNNTLSGICDACGRQSGSLRVINCAPVAGACICEACSPPSEDIPDDEEAGVCGRCGGEGFIEYNDGDPSDWGEDCPSEKNHLIECRECRGTGRI